jgi:hypothetical protein
MDIAEQQMQRMLADARQRVSQILGAEKSPKLASQVSQTKMCLTCLIFEF